MLRNLSVLEYSQGFTMWLYKPGSDALEDTLSPGYFNFAAAMMATGDVIVISGPGSTAMRCVVVDFADDNDKPDRVSLVPMS